MTMIQIIKYVKYDIYQREVHLLSLLNKHVDWCPKLISKNDEKLEFIMEYCGNIISNTNIPIDFNKQLQKIHRNR